jgi:hypothetical protein
MGVAALLRARPERGGHRRHAARRVAVAGPAHGFLGQKRVHLRALRRRRIWSLLHDWRAVQSVTIAETHYAMTQAGAFGIPEGKVLRAQSTEVLTKRRQQAEQSAQLVAVKDLIPLMLYIFRSSSLQCRGHRHQRRNNSSGK